MGPSASSNGEIFREELRLGSIRAAQQADQLLVFEKGLTFPSFLSELLVHNREMNKRYREIASALPVDLDTLPQRSGFRLRGMEMTRLETFTDAAFAFAITMLVIAAQQIPDDIKSLLAAFRNVPTFAFSIAVLGIFWWGHWEWSRRYGIEDGVSIIISWALIVTILIYIYPLKAIFGAMWFLLSDGRVGQALVIRSTESEARSLFAAYALGFTAVSGEIVLLNFRAWQLRDALQLNARERLMTHSEMTGWSIPISVGIVSLLLSQTLPIGEIAWCGWIYFSLPVPLLLHHILRKKQLERLPEGGR